jgi:hypothetical protein
MSRSRALRIAAAALTLAGGPAARLTIIEPERAPEPPTAQIGASRRAAAPPDRPAQRTTPRAAIPAPDRAAARRSARRFVTQYVALIRERGHQITAAALALIRDLQTRPPRVTAAQQRHLPAGRGLITAPDGGLVYAVATLQDPGGPPYTPSFYLERRATGWPATRLADE